MVAMGYDLAKLARLQRQLHRLDARWRLTRDALHEHRQELRRAADECSRALLHETFLTNYLEDRNDTIAGPLAWVRLYMILAQWHTACMHSGSWLRSSFLDFCYRRVASRLIDRIARQG